jgi:hypothetical protein
MVREGRVLISVATDPDFGSTYYVQALEVGAQVASGSAGTTATVRAGHGFAALDKFIVGTDKTKYRTVSGVTSTTLTLNSSISLSAGDLLVNLGQDTGTTEPNYDGNGTTIYTDMDYSNAATNATMQTDANGRYRYYHTGTSRWELVRSSLTVPIAVYVDTGGIGGEGLVSYTVRYAHLFATSGTGTAADPWVRAASNPVQAAISDLPSTGGTVYMIPGHYTLGAATAAVTIPILTSATDSRAYVLEGAGRDLVFLHYTGTGSAIRYPQVNTGSVGSSWQSNRNVFRGFSILQNGTARTGNGIYLSYGSHNLFEDLSIGCLRSSISSGEPDTGFSYGILMEGPPSDEVSDFNTFQGCYFAGNTTGVFMENQCDNAKFYDCHFEPRQDVAVAQNGLLLSNGQGWTIHGCHFNYYDFDTTSYGVRLQTVAQGVDIAGCYFEGNSNGVYLYTDGNQKGIHIHGNFFTGGSTTTAVGVRAGIDGATFTVAGLVVEANSFAGLSTSEIGVRIGSDVKDFKLLGNVYEISGGGTEVLLQTGCRGIRFEPTASATAFPRLQLVDSAQDQGQIILLTNSTAAEFSPRLYFAPGNAGNVFSLSADSTGTLTGKKNDGTTIFQVSQAGALVASSSVTSGGHLRGLKGTTALTGSTAITTAGFFLIDITNTSGSNTFTLTAPSSVDGQMLILRVAAITAGDLSLADSGNVSLSAAWTTPGVGDTLTLVASGVVWYELCRSNN